MKIKINYSSNKILTENDRLKILILEKDKNIIKSIDKILSKDYETAGTDDYSEFRTILNHFNPHILLLDPAVSGPGDSDILISLRNDSKFNDLVILIISDSNDTKAIENSYLNGADDFIQKPLIPFYIKNKIEIFNNIIRSKSNLDLAYNSQLKFQRKLYKLNSLTQKILRIKDIESRFKLAESLNDIIGTGYIELIAVKNKEYETLSQQTFDKSEYLGFNILKEKHNILDGFKGRINTTKIKSGDSSIHCYILSIYHNNVLYGYILLENSLPFTSGDLEMISIISEFFNIINERSTIESVLETKNQDYRTEITKIRKIQVSILPSFDNIKGYEISSSYLPAYEISGDFYDAYFLDDDLYEIVLCDVSGHGMASSYIGNEVRTLFRTISSSEKSPVEIIKNVNKTLSKDMEGLYYFCTVVLFRINLKTNRIQYVNAGHPPILYYNKNEKICHELGHTGPLLGIKSEANFKGKEIILQSGDSIFLYTDGITEAEGDSPETDNMYGEEKLMQIFSENINLPANDIIHFIISSVYEFTDYGDQEDDITAICIKKK